nr:hypothetical protein CFP56_34322 [Quercus suber]
MAVLRRLQSSPAEPYEHPCLELSGSQVLPSNSKSHQCGEGEGSATGFPIGNKCRRKEDTEVSFKSCSHLHIDVVIRDGSMQTPWRAISFYGHFDMSKRHTSWQLLEVLKDQCTMLWVVFSDFNEIMHQHEKLGWMEREMKQMEGFRECLSRCGLVDFGFVGQHFTWCNGQFGEQRTLLRLDRMVANSSWLELFPDAKVYHRSMSSSDHCLLTLIMKNGQPR